MATAGKRLEFKLTGWRLLLAAALVAGGGCRGRMTPEIRVGVDACALCNMVIDQPNQAAGYFRGGGFVPFDSPGCLLRSLHQESGGGEVEGIYFADYESGRFIPADSTHFLLSDHIPTVMNSGILCFADREAATRLKQHADEVITDWRGCRRLKGVPDTVVAVAITDSGMEPEVVSLLKGQVAEWRVTGGGLSVPVTIAVKGYDDAGELAVPAGGGVVTFRLLAHSPGAGFPVVRRPDGAVLGMVKVAGAHTADEEEM